MTDYTLHGNHDPCEACALRREALGDVFIDVGEVPCNECKSTGFIPLSDEEIVRRTVEEARRIYWPAYYARLQAAGWPPEAPKDLAALDTQKAGAPDCGRSGEVLQYALPLPQTDLPDVTLQP